MKERGQPPRWLFRFLNWICPGYMLEEIEGDLIERFNRDLKKHSLGKSKRRLIWNTVRFFRPGIILRNSFPSPFSALFMFSNYFKIASRVVLRNKLFSAVNIFGLMLGLTSALLLGLWIYNEFNFDNFHEDAERLYKVYNRETLNGEITSWDYTPRILAPTLKEEFTFIENAASYARYNEKFLFKAGDKKIINDHGVFTDADFLKIFTFQFLAGNAERALSDPNSIIVTVNFAQILFGKKDVQNEILSISLNGHSFDFKITGVLAEIPATTDFNFDFIIPFSFFENIEGPEKNWNNNSVKTFVKLKRESDIALVNDQVRDLVKIKTASRKERELSLYPVTRAHLYGQFENGVEAGGRIEVINMLIMLAVSLVFIACINFINLSTARAQKRLKEIGIRKMTGAGRSSLILQFLLESVILVIFAGVGSLVLAYFLLPHFNALILQNLRMPWDNLSFWTLMLFTLVAIGLLAGGYPSAYLSSLRPITSLKGEPVFFSKKGVVRKILVVLQFGFAIMLIFSTIVIHSQVKYLQNRKAGYDKENLIRHPLPLTINQHFESYKNELLLSGYVQSVTRTSAPITEQFSSTYAMEWKGKDPDSNIIVERFFIDDDIFTTAGLNLLKGREIDISRYPSDSNAVLLNQAAVKAMGFKDPIGEIIIDDGMKLRVVGVVEDFVLTAPQDKIPPIVLARGGADWFNVVHVRLNRQKPTKEALAEISTIFSNHESGYPFEYHFIENDYNSKFSEIQKTLAISSIFGFIIITIACIGLFALSLYLIDASLKEIGIRKVFGGSVTNIIQLLCWNSIKPIFISLLIFSPVAWSSMAWWLRSYAYRINLEMMYLVVSGLGLVIIALATIIIQTIRAASTNPIKVLRSE